MFHFIGSDRSCKMVIADAAVVRNEYVGSMGAHGQKPHQEFRLFIDTTGGNGYDLDPLRSGF